MARSSGLPGARFWAVGTHDELKRLATELNTTVGNTVSLAVRPLRQDRVGSELAPTKRQDRWLDADLG
jgi:hypothetical protein